MSTYHKRRLFKCADFSGRLVSFLTKRRAPQTAHVLGQTFSLIYLKYEPLHMQFHVSFFFFIDYK